MNRLLVFYRRSSVKCFTEHPASVGETYFGHMFTAFHFGVLLLGAGVACMIHGILPFWFTHTGSSTIRRLHQEMVEFRGRAPNEPAV